MNSISVRAKSFALFALAAVLASFAICMASVPSALADDGLAAGDVGMQAGSTADAVAEAFEISESGSKTYQLGVGFTQIPVRLKVAGYAYLEASVSGAGDDLYVTKGATPMDFSEDNPNVSFTNIVSQGKLFPVFGEAGAEQIQRMGVLSLAPGASSVTVTITAKFYPLATSAKRVSPKENIEISQKTGTKLYWKVVLKKSRVLDLIPDNTTTTGSYLELCNSKKKVLDGDGSYSNSGASRYILKKGTYYIRTAPSAISNSTMERVAFSYKTSGIGSAFNKNTSIKRAASLKLGKQAKGLIPTVPRAKAYYYKLDLKTARKVSVSYRNQTGYLTSVWLLDANKDVVVGSKSIYNSKKGKFKFLDADSFFDSIADKKKAKGKTSVKLPAGTYYLKVVPEENRCGKYAITVK